MKSSLSQLAQRTESPAISWLMELRLTRPKLISLAAGFTDNPSLPLRETRAICEELLSSSRRGRPALQYGSTAGDPELRRLSAERLRRSDGVERGDAHSAARTLLTSGSQQLLYMLAEALCDEGDIVLVEDPTYFVFLGIAQSRGLRCRGVRMQPDGLDLAHLDEVLGELRRRGELHRVKMLYLVSYFSNPAGITTSFAKKAAALKLLKSFERAAGHPIYLLEDAAYRELRFAGEDVPSALAVEGFADRVLYTGTYSKPFASGVRVGFGTLPGPVLTAVTRIKGNHDFGTAHFIQHILSRALVSGRFDRHLTELRKRYAEKAVVLTAALREHAGAALAWDEPRGGLYVWAKAAARTRTGVKSKLFNAALAKDVLYVPGALCYCDDVARPKPDHEMRLSFGNASEDEMREGIRRLGAVLGRL